MWVNPQRYSFLIAWKNVFSRVTCLLVCDLLAQLLSPVGEMIDQFTMEPEF